MFVGQVGKQNRRFCPYTREFGSVKTFILAYYMQCCTYLRKNRLRKNDNFNFKHTYSYQSMNI